MPDYMCNKRGWGEKADGRVMGKRSGGGELMTMKLEDKKVKSFRWWIQIK
jgi:hypothetical protein